MAVAVIDIGKTNAKLILADEDGGEVLEERSTANAVVTGGLYPHFDVDGLWAWILEGLGEFSRRATVTDVVPVAHGAAAALVGDDDLTLPVLDYEFQGPESVSARYEALRSPFEEIYSPSLPGGLNIGRQLLWLEEAFPDRFERARWIVPYPQYWAWRLSGVAASEITSLGAHSDLWNVAQHRLADICDERRWSARIPGFRKAWEVLGNPTRSVVDASGLPEDCRIRCGVHDSNASLLPYLQGEDARSTVVATGTWAITFALGGSLTNLDEHRDCLANIDVFGNPVPSARFMGGREFELLTESCSDAPSDPGLLPDLYEDVPMILPTLVPGIGPFGTSAGGWVAGEGRSSTERRTAAGLYMAALAATCRALTGGRGPIVVEGPFARNPAFVQALADITGTDVRCMTSAGGTLSGAVILAHGLPERPTSSPGYAVFGPGAHRPEAIAYFKRWTEQVTGSLER